METFAYYEDSGKEEKNTGIATLAAVIASATGTGPGGFETGTLRPGMDNIEGMAGLLGQEGDKPPGAYLNYLLFNKSNAVERYGFVRVTENANHETEQLAIEDLVINIGGHLHMYVSNEGETVKPIYFDDLKIVQHTSASPEEMAIAESATMISLSVPTENNYLYQGIELQTDLDLDWYHFELRMYDPFISRFVISDPADQFNSPYLAMGNNPILATDPTGGFSPIYDSEGNYLGTDSEGFTGDVLIFNDPTKFVQGMDHDQALKIGMHFDDTKLSPQIEARIYTHIMSNMELPDGSLLDINDLVNSSISIQRPSGTFNKPELGKFHQWTTTPGGNGKINITAGTYSCETTVENIRASAGIHEYFGHGKQGKSDRYGNHHEAFAMTIESNLLGKYDRSIQEKYLETK